MYINNITLFMFILVVLGGLWIITKDLEFYIRTTTKIS